MRALRLRLRRWLAAFATTLATFGLVFHVVPGSAQSTSAGVDSKAADLWLVVDCLLPGQVRQLGGRTTYLSARRPARLSARDCQIRGGEYVAHDRADLHSALAAWLPLAESGDIEAQVIVGEIHERGLGVLPDYVAASQWYRRAAEAGSHRAQVNLGQLYERGLGVTADPRAALEWYRRAAGDQTPLTLDAPSTRTAPQVNPAELEAARARARELETTLATTTQELESARRSLASAQAAAATAQATAATAEATAQVAAAKLEALPSKAPDRSAEVAELQSALAARTREAHDARTRLETSTAELAQRESQLSAQLAQRDSQLAAQKAQAERLARELASVNAVATTRGEETQRLQRLAAERLLAGPQVSIVEPELVRTRDIVPVAIAQGTDRQVVGRVLAPAGLLALTVNDALVTPNELGVFSAQIALAATDAPVRVVAVDRQGKRDEVRFVLRSSAPPPTPTPATSQTSARGLTADVDFGTYHALIIGNNDYRYLPDLTSPINDADDLARVLGQHYGFKTTVLHDADRYQILSALNTLRETLTPHDNLLIYFAGHGELDEVNQRGHWLPVDAERDSTANWIPTTALTDILNIMRAKQVLLVVDSCYAGALTRSAMGRLATGMTDAERLHWFRTMATKRSRTVLTSGGIAPVMDAGGGRHSVFAKALLEVLERNDEPLDGLSLHREVAARVAYAAANLRFDQVPEYAPIRFAGHEAGEFFLVPGR